MNELCANASIGQIADLVRGVTYAKSEASESPRPGYVPILRATNIQDSSLAIADNLVYVPSERVSENQQLRPNDIVVATSSGSKHLVGKSALMRSEWHGSFGAFCAVIRPKALVDARYLAAFLQSRSYWKQIGEKANGININNLRRGDIESVSISLPTLVEQQSAVSEIEKQFSRLDEAVANLQRVGANLKRYKASVLKAVFGRCLLRGRIEPLATVAEVQLGQQRAPVHAAAREQVPYVRAANITWDGLDLSDVKTMGFPNPDRYRLQVGDVLLAEASGSAKEVGKPAIWNGEVPGACYQKTLIRIRAKPDKLTHRFVYYFFLHTCLSGEFARLAPGVGILHLTAERMLDWPIVVPEIEEQNRMIAEFDRCVSFATELEIEVDANLKRAQSLRQAILAKAFSDAHA